MADSYGNRTQTARVSLSVTPEQRDNFKRLCALEGRSGSAEFNHLVDQRLAEVEGGDNA